MEQAGELGETGLAWQLPVALFGAFLVRRPLRTWVRTHLIGIDAATADGRLPVVAWLHTSVGLAYRGLREYPAAVRHLEAGLDAWRELDERWAQAWAMRDLGHVHSLMGDHARAEGMLRTALEMHVAEGDSFGEATALALLGAVELGLDRPDDALRSFRRSLAIREEHGDPRNIAIVRTELSTALLRVGDLESARAEAAGALELNQAIDDWRCEAMAHEALGNAMDATGDRAGAVEHWRAALVLFDKLGDPHADDLRTRAG
ncbi:tetratricopeptide repeat protein [Actinokineospora soli]|uniref:Tetratricopeptide repeat protein n=1 Tax=Actinokineospora soli TaxID=1048753 RepID=A0ABW2TUM6_9PSEU